MFAPDPESTGESTVVGFLYAVRPWQWYKQGILFLAVVFSGSAFDVTSWLRVTAGAVLFCMVAGGTYVLNDVSDRSEDRNHPRKRHRPIASGQIPVRTAVLFAIAAYGIAGALSWRLNPVFFGLVIVYVAQNFLYSVALREYLFVDLFSISAGFVIRAIAGVVLVSAPLSPWIILCTFLAALMLGVSKRWGERTEITDPASVRNNLEGYSEQTLKFLFGTVATMLLMSYSLYTFFARDLAMMLTLPFAFYAVFRFAHLTFANDGASTPVSLLLERPMLVNFTLWGVFTVVIIYQQTLKGAM